MNLIKIVTVGTATIWSETKKIDQNINKRR